MRVHHCVLSKAILMGTILTMQSALICANKAGEKQLKLFDFTSADNVDDWTEISDTVRRVGMSKAVLTLQKTQQFQRGIFFTLLNPQPNGAGFAGVRTQTSFNLDRYCRIEIYCRAQGSCENYKVVLRHKGLSADSDVSYEQFFSVPTADPEYHLISLDLSKFLPYFRGQLVPNAEPLDTSNITMFGLQVYGGVYSPVKQKGVSSLEIEFIMATCSDQSAHSAYSA